VRLEGQDHGFRVVVVHPEDENWARQVLDAVAVVQAQLDWQHSFKRPAPATQTARAFSS